MAKAKTNNEPSPFDETNGGFAIDAGNVINGDIQAAQEERKKRDAALHVRIAKKYSERIVFFDGVPHVKHDGIWTSDINAVGNLLRQEHDSLTQGQFREALATMRDLAYPHPVKPIETNYINFLNGRYDINTHELREYEDTDVIFNRVNAEYNAAASESCDVVDEFISYLADGCADEIQMIWEMIGYSLSPENSMQRAHLLIGEAGTGKSVLLNLLERLIGTNEVMAVRIGHLNDPRMLASIYGKSLCIIDDADTSRQDDISGFKTIVSGGAIAGKLLYQEPFTFHYGGKFIMSSNSIPKMFDAGSAVARRLIIIPCTSRTIPESKRDRKLLSKLLDNSEYIIKRGLKAYEALMKRNLFIISERSAEFVQEGVSFNNPWVEYFAELSAAGLEGKSRNAVYENYKAWNRYNGTGELSQKRFWLEFSRYFTHNSTGKKENGKFHRYLTEVKRLIGEDPSEDEQIEIEEVEELPIDERGNMK